MYTLKCETFCLCHGRQNTAFKFGISIGIFGQGCSNELGDPRGDQSSEETPVWWTSLLFILNITYVLLLSLLYFSLYISVANDMKIKTLLLGGLFLKRNLVLDYLYLLVVMHQVQLVSGKLDGIVLLSRAE